MKIALIFITILSILTFVQGQEDDRHRHIRHLKIEIHELMAKAEAIQQHDPIEAEELRKYAENLKRKLEIMVREEHGEHHPKHHQEMRHMQERQRKERHRQEERPHHEGEEFRKEPHHPDNVFEFLQRFAPDKLKELEELKREEPEQYEKELREVAAHVHEMHELQRHNPQQFATIMQNRKMTRKSWELAEACRREENAERKMHLRQQLQHLLQEIFNMRIELHKKEVHELRNALNKLQNRLQRMIENKEKIIKKRMHTMLSEDDEFDWE